MTNAEDYRARALAAELSAQRSTDPNVKMAYQELARSWLEVMRHSEWLDRGRTGLKPFEK
jgi:hypothetical protein